MRKIARNTKSCATRGWLKETRHTIAESRVETSIGLEVRDDPTTE